MEEPPAKRVKNFPLQRLIYEKLVPIRPNNVYQSPKMSNKKCIVLNCDATNDPDIGSVSLPTAPHMRNDWLLKCRRRDLIAETNSEALYCVCAAHFKPEDFIEGSKNEVKKFVIPSIFKYILEIDPSSSAAPGGKNAEAPKIEEPSNIAVYAARTYSSPAQRLQSSNTPIVENVPAALVPSALVPSALVPSALVPSALVPAALDAADLEVVTSEGGVRQSSLGDCPAPAPNVEDVAENQPVEPTSSPKKKGQKLVLSVPKWLYKKYTSRKITLQQLTEEARKLSSVKQVQIQDKPAKAMDQSIQSKVITKVTNNQDKDVIRERIYVPLRRRQRLPKPTKPPLETVGDVLKNAPDVIRVHKVPLLKVPPLPPQELSVLETSLNTVEVSAQVHQVAPQLPIKAVPAAFNMLKWDVLIPTTFRDWPVPASVVFAAANQLKQNYLTHFTMEERLEIETVLHMVGHFTSLCSVSRCHVRERIHYYLKKLQLELVTEKDMAISKKKKKNDEETGDGDKHDDFDGDKSGDQEGQELPDNDTF